MGEAVVGLTAFSSANKMPETLSPPNMPPRWLEHWRPDHKPPVPASEIRESIIFIEGILAPMSKDQIIEALMPLAVLFDATLPSPTSAAMYPVLLGDLPAFALGYAVNRCLRECRFYPMPAEIRDRVPGELSQC